MVSNAQLIVSFKCLAQEHNTKSPARTRTLAYCTGVERTNHEATTPSYKLAIKPKWIAVEMKQVSFGGI